MVSERLIAQSATLQSIVRSGRELGGMSQPTIATPIPDSVPERQAQRRVQRRRTVDSARTHDYQTSDSVAARSTFDDLDSRTHDDARAARYQEQVQRVANIRKSTKPQRNYIVVLLEKLKEHNGTVWQEANEWWQRLDSASEPSPIPFALADKTIKRLLHYLSQPKGAPALVQPEGPKFDPYDDIPNGRYAIQLRGSQTKLHFYRVSRWKGSNRIKLQEQASDALYPVRHWGHARNVLDAIRSNPREAAEIYARELEQCYRCGRTLTDADSRSKGIGPECEKKGMGW